MHRELVRRVVVSGSGWIALGDRAFDCQALMDSFLTAGSSGSRSKVGAFGAPGSTSIFCDGARLFQRWLALTRTFFTNLLSKLHTY